MICQRCGLCCVTMPVVINVDGRAKAKIHDVACPHLELGKQAVCKAHEEPWYENSPCHTYGNSYRDPDFFPKRGRPCPVGSKIMQTGGLRVLFPQLRWAKPSELEDLDAWPERE